MMICPDFSELAALEALGALDESSRDALLRHLAECESCRADRATFAATWGVFGYSAPAAPVAPELKRRLFERIGRETSAQPPVVQMGPHRRGRRPKAPSRVDRWAIASIALLIGFSGALVSVGFLARQVAEERQQSQHLASELSNRERQVALLQAQDVRVASLAGQPPAPGATAKVFWSPRESAWVVSVAKLPPATTGKTYQLWAVTSSRKISVGTFQTDAHGAALIEAKLPLSDRLAAAAVSLEPAGGVPQPTGAIVLLGTF
jgi:anti-sigma-K factor RskA